MKLINQKRKNEVTIKMTFSEFSFLKDYIFYTIEEIKKSDKHNTLARIAKEFFQLAEQSK